MGVPSQSQIQTWTDAIAARMATAIQGRQAEYGHQLSPTNGGGMASTSLFDMVDGSGDPDVEGALAAVSNAIDKHSLPEVFGDSVIPNVNGLTAFRNWVTALNQLVTGASGGSYSSMAAYLEDKAATLDPLFAELARSTIGDNFAPTGDVLSVNAPLYGPYIPDRIYQGPDGTLLEETTDARSSTTADVTLFAADNDALYVGCDCKFSAIVVALSTLSSADIVATFQYWNGNAWATLTVTDSTVGFTKNDRIKFTPPADWQRCYKDGGGNVFADLARRYYVRIARTANTVVTPPVGTCIRVVPVLTPFVTNSASHLGWQQPPLLLARITGTNTIAVELPYGLSGASILGVDYNRFIEPGIILRALTPIANNLTVTISYTNQDGDDVTQAQSSWTAPAALGTKAVTLNGADTGVRACLTTSWAVTTTSTEGVFVVESVVPRTPAI